MNDRKDPILYIVIPCYNEQEVLPITAPLFLQKINDLAAAGKISPDSRVLFVNDGSRDRTWEIINELAASGKCVLVISSELPEIIGISDRIIVMREGRLMGELDYRDATEENIISLASVRSDS